MFYIAIMIGLMVGTLYAGWWILFRKGRDAPERQFDHPRAPMSMAAASRLADQKLARQWLKRDVIAFVRGISARLVGSRKVPRGRLSLTLPTEIQAEISSMAQADSRSYDEELTYLLRRGLEIPRNLSIADEAFIIAELAYLRAEELDDNRWR